MHTRYESQIMTKEDKIIYIEFAKFLQNCLLDLNYKIYLIGGSLINSIRDNGNLLSDDIDFALISDNQGEDDLYKLIKDINHILPSTTWYIKGSFLRIYLYGRDDFKIDIFLFIKKHLNYYMRDITWINERIQHFQTFKYQKVILENKEFHTMYRPDLFLTTVYGNWKVKNENYFNIKGGDTSHLRECDFYIDTNDYDKIDFKIQNLKLFFLTVHIKQDLSKTNHEKINIFHDNYSNILEKKSNIFYSDFKNFLLKNEISFDDF